jgi:outer membrane immunogenic protein
MIRSLIMAGVALLALAGVAFAADLPSLKAPPIYVPPPVPTWTGFYIGVNGGYGFGDFSFDTHDPAGLLVAHAGATSDGFIGGGQGGFNYQFPSSNFVLGGEADFDGSTVEGTYSPPSVPLGTVSSKLDWLGTARARLGLAFGNILPYVTGGFAYGHVDTYSPVGGVLPSFSIDQTLTGWTAGAGLEYAITHNLSFKTEYLYVDLSNQGFQVPGSAATHTTHPTLNVVRAGLDWKFDWIAPPTPVVAKY